MTTDQITTMYDSASNDQFPADPQAVAAYVDGGIGDQPNYAHVVSAYPGAQHLSIALFASDDADALDVEPGASAPSDIPGWHARQVARGITRPVIYASVAAMNDAILPVLSSAGIGAAQRRLWTAHYGLGAHICGPGTCGSLSIGADGTQWTPNALGRNLDQSLLLPDFFGSPVPADWVLGPVRDLKVDSVTIDTADLSWVSPGTPMPEAVEHYQVTVRYDGHDVGPYPVAVPKTANPEKLTVVCLRAATEYTALVRAVAKDGGHASEWVTAGFKTKTHA